MKAIERAREYSEKQLARLRDSLSGLAPSEVVILTCGSYARREASEQSDIDYFIITDGDPSGGASADESWIDHIRRAIGAVVSIDPAERGAFSKVENRHAMLHNIGGDQDTNQKITRRMLFLLEGEWLSNGPGLRQVRRDILERYIAETITDHQLALFLLNDMIRYYRTMATDYEFKTVEGDAPKPWGIRNIKLVFSRKLLYASGLFSVGLTADRARDAKVDLLQDLFELPVIDRMVTICGRANSENLLASYNLFLEKLEDLTVRDHLKSLDRRGRTDPVFRMLKNEGHHFTRELLKLFETTFDSTHPIRRAVIF
jgi:hypothetical protein